MDAFDGLNTASHTFSLVKLDDYQEQVVYDPNGNILTYSRNGNQHPNVVMDKLNYTYGNAGNNQLTLLTDNATDGGYTGDIKAPPPSGISYTYDQIGNLTSDGANSLTWTVYGKIATQTGASGLISYGYDAGSNRIAKTTSSGTTLYVRDAQGNVLSTYQRGTSGNFAQSEIDLYGSSRLGMTRAPALRSSGKRKKY